MGAKKTPVDAGMQTPADFDRLISSFKITLDAQNLSKRTIETYTDSVRDFARFLHRKPSSKPHE